MGGISMTFEQLKEMALEKVNPRQLTEYCHVGLVSSALLTEKGHVYVGVNIDASSGMGFCAEHSAIAQMIANGESGIQKIVAVSVGGKVYPPCGRCREFMYRINYDNLDTEILVDDNKVVKLSEILPYRYD
jgi:cytidine deaminase